MTRILCVFVLIAAVFTGKLQAQTASFNFSYGPQHITDDWINIHGNPAGAICSGTSIGITVSSVAAGNWAPYSDGMSAYDGGGASNGTFFGNGVMANTWFQYGGFLSQYNALLPQLLISGLNKDSVYTLKMTGSNQVNVGGFVSNPMRYTVKGAVLYGFVDVNGEFNISNGAVFNNVAPAADGTVSVYINTYNGSNLACIGGLQVIRGRTTGPSPVVSITHPSNNQLLPEDGVITVSATATETGGSITKVEFYANDLLLATDSVSPYTFNWSNADPGRYTLKARAIDGFGITAVKTVDVTVQSLNYFWSTTGNIATGGDTSFVGTVDSNRLAIRTRNKERISISPIGTTDFWGSKDPVNHPSLRIYDNGDLVAGTTMEKTVNTDAQTGMRYHGKLGILEIGASDRLDTTINPIVYGPWPTSGLIINSDEPNIIKGKLMNTVLAGNSNLIDSGTRTENAFIGSENSHFYTSMDNFIRSYMGGYNNSISATTESSMISGAGMIISKPFVGNMLNGFANITMDTSYSSVIGGSSNLYGGVGQLVSGSKLINKTPYGTTLGSSNVDFTTLPYTGIRGAKAANIAQYPLFVIGNGANNDGAFRSNALTMLYNGRTQINTTGHTVALSQTAVIPQAALDVVSTNTGVLLPRLTTAQRNAIVAGDLHPGLLLYNSDSSAFQFYNGTGWNTVGSGSGSGQPSRWKYSNGTVFDTDDNVAIGTDDAKGYMLAVKGSALFTKVQVRSVANWPDYVFDKSYRLRSLEDLETYIGKYKHLPEMISAAKAGAEGLDIATSQGDLLKKVEELTLYLIDENKQLRSQTGQLTEQNRKMAVQDKQIAEQNKVLAEQNARFQDQQRQIDELKALLNKK